MYGGLRSAACLLDHPLGANLVIAWHLLTDNCDYADLGGDYFVRRDTDRQRQRLSPSCKPSATRSPSNPSLPNTRGFTFQDEVRRAESLRLVSALADGFAWQDGSRLLGSGAERRDLNQPVRTFRLAVSS